MRVFIVTFNCRRSAAIAGLCVLLAGCADEPAPPALLIAEPAGCGAQLGCTTERNIAAMVDRPADLAAPRHDKPRDAVRRDTVITAWRAGGMEQQAPTLHPGSSQP